MSATHHSLVQKEVRKYRRKGWLVLTEVDYKRCIFDILAIHPETKEIEIAEVILSTGIPEKKRKIAESLGKLRELRPYAKLAQTKIIPKEVQPILRAISNPLRLAILEAIGKQDSRFIDVISTLGLNSRKHAGHWVYHVNQLWNVKLIRKTREGKYTITEKGKRCLALVKGLE